MTQTLKIGTTLQAGRFKIVKVLGESDSCITYLAENQLLRTMVAIKEFFLIKFCERDVGTSRIVTGIVDNREMVKYYEKIFQKMARDISQFYHPNIVKVHSVFVENNTTYYVMDYIDGESLLSIVKQRGALPETEALFFIRQVGAALDFLHSKNLNHLDVKPSNIIVRHADGQVILVGFGISCHDNSDTGESPYSTPIGISEGYSPIEQYKPGGIKEFSPQTDIYALGATLYHLLTGVIPPPAVDNLCGGTLEMSHNISSRTCKTIARAMSPNRTDRQANIKQFIAMLDGEEPISEKEKKVNNKNIVDKPVAEKKEHPNVGLWPAVIGIAIGLFVSVFLFQSKNSKSSTGTQTIPELIMCPECPDDNHPHSLDLGLPSGTKWACCNVGATTPEDYGDYFAWGETELKSRYNWNTYAYGNSSYECQNIGFDISLTKYDVAHVKWGDNWRMPSLDQIKELKDRCKRTLITMNGVRGTLVTGPNGKSVFLPAAGKKDDEGFIHEGRKGYYWSSSLSTNLESFADYLYVQSGGLGWSLDYRSNGYSVRPVCQ